MSQSSSALTNITGVAIEYAAGNAEGNGVLDFTFADKTFTWMPNGGTVGEAVAVTEDGKYAVFGLNDIGLLCFDVDYSSLPGIDQSDTVEINNQLGLLFEDVSRADSFTGETEYRCYYMKNTHATQYFLEMVLFMGQQPTPGTVAFGLDPAGINGVAATPADEHTAPAGVTFSVADSEGTGISFLTEFTQALQAGDYIAVWLRRVIAPRNIVANEESVALVNAQTYF